jgi:hypothetical protein
VASLRAGTFEDFELIIVDDASDDATPALIEAIGPETHITLEENVGCHRARNIAIAKARGELLFFMDDDVTLRPDALERVVRHHRTDPDGCVIGLYSKDHPNPNLCSRYKNAWVRFTYLRSRHSVRWFVGAVGMIPRSVWDAHGGFEDDRNYHDPEDMWWGRRVTAAGVPITLDASLEVIHWKSFALLELLGNDLLRAFHHTRRVLETRIGPTELLSRGFGNIPGHFLAGAALSGIIVPTAALSFFFSAAGVLLLLLAALYLVCSLPFLKHVACEYSRGASLAFLPLMFADHLAAAGGAAAALLVDGLRGSHRREDRQFRRS